MDARDEGSQPKKPARRCEGCGQVRPEVRRGPAEPRFLCHLCWAGTRPQSFGSPPDPR